jgi:ankyrin repeat protein
VHSADLDQIERHLFWGTDVNQAGPDGRFALQVAVANGRIAIARELLDHGARLDVRDPLGNSPLYVALANGRAQMAAMLLERGAADDPQVLLQRLITEGHLDRDSLALLVSVGVDLNALGPEGLAPLHLAVRDGELKMTKWLLQQGADVNRLSATGASPLDMALAAAADANVIRTLEQYGADR